MVLCGLSAGAICWFKYGNSDSRKFTSKTDKLIKVTGLGFIEAIMCPHYDTEIHRQEDLKKMTKKSPFVSIALEENCAIQILDDKYKIITSNQNAKAYKIYWKKGEYFKKEVEKSNDFLDLTELIKKE